MTLTRESYTIGPMEPVTIGRMQPISLQPRPATAPTKKHRKRHQDRRDAVTVVQASIILNVSESTVRRLIQREELPARTSGGIYWIDRAAVHAYRQHQTE